MIFSSELKKLGLFNELWRDLCGSVVNIVFLYVFLVMILLNFCGDCENVIGLLWRKSFDFRRRRDLRVAVGDLRKWNEESWTSCESCSFRSVLLVFVKLVPSCVCEFWILTFSESLFIFVSKVYTRMVFSWIVIWNLKPVWIILFRMLPGVCMSNALIKTVCVHFVYDNW